MGVRAGYEGSDGLRRWEEDAIQDDYVVTRFLLLVGVLLVIGGAVVGIASLAQVRS